ncbi:DUF2927 domain-containing protein [Shewanella sp. JM162201]|uniref:DUF2927 domain-containing protein n=1 Tax=Shewanella jiangmenensis TaxID=2837387 RepID=A0ABS5UZE2_9GAMM|nr:DUF2927 domain-containing protein [Shewanella jiangmenensis]MBT1443535.1 DUF2927 domain-containing protein [Shewanella jiangmenensis]
MRIASFSLLSLVCCSALALGEQPLSPQPYSDPAYVAKAFTAVVHGREYEQGSFVLSRWPGDIRYRVHQQVSDPQALALIEMHLAQLADISGRRFVKVEDGAALDIYLTRASAWRKLIGSVVGEKAAATVQGAVCLASFNAPAGKIERAQVFIPIDQARMQGKLVSCVVEELTQVMGLPNDSDAVFPSVFNDRSPEELLTPLDWLLLRLLYDDRLESGMSAAESAPKVSAILNDWQQDGTLQRARSEVLKGEIYRLLGRRR